MTSKKTRRAAGTTTVVDVLLRWAFIQRRSAEQDRADLDAGQTLKVAAFSKTLGGEALIPVGKGKKIARLKAGTMRLSAGQAPVWVERGRQGITLAPPLELQGEGDRLPVGNRFRMFTLTTGQGSFDLVIPLADAELVRHSFATTDA